MPYHPVRNRTRLVLFLLSLGSFSGASAATYRKKPHLLPSDSSGKMHLVYQTDAIPNSVSVSFGRTTSANDAMALAPAQTNSDLVYRADLTGLTGGALYYYKITLDGSVDTGSFVAPRAADSADFTFYAYGDTRTNLSAHDGVAKALLSDLNQDPAGRGTFVLHCGDYVATGSSESDWTTNFFNTSTGPNVQRMLANLPLYGCIGNHEGTAGYPILKKYFPYPFLPASGQYFSFDQGPVHVAVVDVETVGYASGSTQNSWLKNDLAAATAPLKVVMWHSPAYSAGGGHADNTTIQSELVPLCIQNGVKVIICGDNHYYSRIVVNGIHHITTGGGGAPLYTPVASTANLTKSASAYHFIRFQVLGNATILRGTAIKSDGSIIESFDIPLAATVATAPAITTQPASQSVAAGQTATFTVMATGTPAPTYQWKKNGTAISGATGASYATPATTTADTGASFTVTVTNPAGSLTSNAATLTVNSAATAPAITTQPASQTVAAGQTATFTVMATCTPAPTYQWKKNGTAISGATGASFTTPATTTADTGASFTVTVTNPAGSLISNAATLIVGSTASRPTFDLNGDGLVDMFDVLSFLKRLGSTQQMDLLKADFNQDGRIDDSDLSALLSAL